jgi:hypothetical protein
MPLTDFEAFSSDVDAQIILNILTPLVDTGSLRFNLASGGHGNIAPDSGGAFDHGFTSLRYQTIMRIDVSGIASNPGIAGITCMQSHHSLVGTGKSFYFFGILNSLSDFDTAFYVFRKYTDGLNAYTTIAPNVTTNSGVIGAVKTLRIDAIVDIPNLGGTWLRCYYGTATDFSNMTQFCNVVDYTNPLTTSVNEGLFLDSATPSSRLEVCFDNTSLYAIT